MPAAKKASPLLTAADWCSPIPTAEPKKKAKAAQSPLPSYAEIKAALQKEGLCDCDMCIKDVTRGYYDGFKSDSDVAKYAEVFRKAKYGAGKAAKYFSLYGGNPPPSPVSVVAPSWLSPIRARKPEPVAPKYRTQKVRGIMALCDFDPFGYYQLYAKSIRNMAVQVYPHITTMPQLPSFARPCPTVPRHGFVDSHVVNTQDEVLKVIADTQAADPSGEVLFMPRLTGQWSGIVTHAGVTFGLANDGATAGKSAVTVPAYQGSAEFKDTVGANLCAEATIKEAPYLEFVEHEGKAAFVQLRDGPEVPRSANYIPETVEVREVVTTNGEDLLEWEAKIADYAGKEGVVVHHPGGALTSHYSVHCIVHRIPVVLDAAAPKVGGTLVPAGWEPAPLTMRDYRVIADYISRRFNKGFPSDEGGSLDDENGLYRRYHTQRRAVLTSIATLHALPQWGNAEHLLRLRAEGVAAVLLFSASACISEARHFTTQGPGRGEEVYDEAQGRSVYKNQAEQKLDEAVRAKNGRKLSREDIYARALVSQVRDLTRWLGQAREDFATEGWSSGYGGPAWQECSDASIAGFAAVERFIAKPNAITWTEVVSTYNRLIHVAHNGGALLTKWVEQGVMDSCAENPGPAFVNPFAARVALGLEKLPKVTKKATLAEFLKAA